MAMRQDDDSVWKSVILFGLASLIVLTLVSGCSTVTDEPQAELTQQERITDLKKRLLATHTKLHMQRAALQKLINNDADLDKLLRLMYVSQPVPVEPGTQNEDEGKEAQSKQINTDYLQQMTANQAAMKSDLAELLQEINALSATAKP